MRVRIDAGGRTVEIECPSENTTVKDVAAEALTVWQATDGAHGGTEGPAYGFSAERRSDSHLEPMSMSGGRGPGYVRKVNT